jgi:D-serine deaminase-like pyridoxal phosphate-dependent protein
LCDEAGVANRPHIKTHKNAVLARRQVEAGAIGVACQKLGEAEVMADAGITDILICYNIIGAARSGRLETLLRRADLTIAADNPLSLGVYAEAAARAGRCAGVVIECDTGPALRTSACRRGSSRWAGRRTFPVSAASGARRSTGRGPPYSTTA